MKVLSRLQFPSTPEASGLYFHLEQSSINFKDNQIILPQDITISLNTYFNSIYENYYTKYTNISSLYYLLNLKGDFAVAAYREKYQVGEKELIYHQIFKECQSEDVKVVLPELKASPEAGRIYLEVTSLKGQGLLTQGLLITEQENLRDVSLAIIACTYKKEAYVKKTVNAILQDKLLANKKFKIFVVDNAKTLNQSDFDDNRVQLIPNRNVGGSGGFTKGLISALQEGSYTHFLFMDDDIELDSEVIYRLFSLYEYAQDDFAVAGSMLNLHEKHVLYEAGALYNKGFDNQGNIQHRPFILTSVKHNLDLLNTDTLNSLLVEESVDFGGFYFFCFSKQVVEKIGLPLPFFIKIDDIEFSLRVKQYLENRIVAFPSLAVWHEPFYTKKPAWDAYYSFRNMLITNSIHDFVNYADAVKVLTMGIIYHLLLFNYNTAKMYIKAFEDYMQGPDFIRSNDPESLHFKICEESKSHASQTVITNANLNSTPTTKANKFQKMLSLLTLNGHLLPPFLIRDESAIIRSGTQESDSICKGFAKRRVIVVIANTPHSYQNELDNQAGINILLSWVKSALGNRWKWSSVMEEWKQAAPDFTSIQFWQHYLEPEQQNRKLAQKE